MKTKTKTQIKNEAKDLFRDLKKLKIKLNKLMEDCENSNEKEGEKTDWFQKATNTIESSRNSVELAYDDLESVTGPMP